MENKNLQLRIAGREPNSIVDGDGLRYVIFFQGCEHFCKNCHNKETWNYNNGISSSVENEIELLKQHIDYIDGITISGGDPFFQYHNLLELCKSLKKSFNNINIWVYTGYTLAELQKKGFIEALQHINTLVDGKYIEELKSPHLAFVGSSNQRVIKLQ